MDFSLSDEQQMLKKSVKDFMKKEYPREAIRELDEKEEYPFEAIKKWAELGWLGLPFPEEYGGMGGNAVDLCCFVEELTYWGGLTFFGPYIHSVIFGGMSINAYGTEEQKKNFLPGLINGELIYSLSFTEPNAGSDLANISTSAVKDGNNYILNGAKVFTSGAHVANYLLLGARTDKDAPRHKGISVFMVDTKSPGLEMRKIKKMGMKSVATSEIFLEDVKVPEERLLGGPESLNKGWTNMLRTLTNERCYVAAAVAGSAQSVIDDCIEYGKQRVQFGQPIGKFQAVQHTLVDMQIEVETSRLLAYLAAWRLDQGLPCMKESSMAKLYASEVFSRVSEKGLLLFGGYGYTMEYDMQRHFRDAIFYQIGGGVSMTIRNHIAGAMDLYERK